VYSILPHHCVHGFYKYALKNTLKQTGSHELSNAITYVIWHSLLSHSLIYITSIHIPYIIIIFHIGIRFGIHDPSGNHRISNYLIIHGKCLAHE
jgi:hypothetical protein